MRTAQAQVCLVVLSRQVREHVLVEHEHVGVGGDRAIDHGANLPCGGTVGSRGMDRINHVKIVTPDPEAIDRFLREVVDVPAGWSLGAAAEGTSASDVVSPARDADGNFTVDSVHDFRGASSFGGGFITGSTESRQFQILKGEEPHIWGIAIGTRNVERAHARCVERGIPCTEPAITPWGNDGGAITFFFAEVAGIVFEVMRAEAAG